MTADFVVRLASPETVAAESARGERNMMMRAMIRIIRGVRELNSFWFFPDTDRQDKNHHDDHGAHRTEWTKYSDDILLINDI